MPKSRTSRKRKSKGPGGAHNHISNFEKTIADYERAMGINPASSLAHGDREKIARAYYERAVREHNSGSYQTAVADYGRAMIVDPEYVEALHDRDVLKPELDNDQSKLPIHVPNSERLLVSPDGGVMNLGSMADISMVEFIKSAFGMTDARLVMRDLTRLLPRDIKFAYNLNQRGLEDLALGDLDAAITAFTAAIGFYEHYTSAYYNRGVAKTVNGDYLGAIIDYGSCH